MERFAQLQEKARRRTGQSFRIIVVQEAGLDGFWIHRALQNEGIESHVVDAASIATSVGAGGQRPTRSMVKRWFERCSPTSAANLGSVQWSRCLLPAKKTAATSAASAKR
jgi:transposase